MEPNLEGCGAFLLSKKLSYLKTKLYCWAKDTFGATNLHKKSLLGELNLLDTIGESWSLSKVESSWSTKIRSKLFTILNQEEIY